MVAIVLHLLTQSNKNNYNTMQDQEQEPTSPQNNQSNLLSLQAKPRRIKKDNRIKIDISKTQYPLLRNVSVNELGWKIWTREQSKEEINVYWADTYVPDEQVKRIKTYQRINHFPASENLGKKNLLTSNLSRMKKLLPNQYLFYPQTFNFPNEAEQFEKFSKSRQDKYCIVKPSCDSQGRGIYLTKMNELNVKQEMVVQEYVQNPLLIEGMKFDLRIYVLLKSIFPLKIYMYQEGLSRLATCSYEKPSSTNKKNMRMHLTNYAINKFSPNFVFNKSQQQDHIGHKRSYTATIKAIEKLGCEIDKLQNEIDKIIVKTIMSAYQHLQKKYKQVRDIKQEVQSVCFQILGFDILIKQDFTPLLLQVNHSPSFSTDSPLDLAIKKCLILDTLNILNLNHQQKITYLKNKNDHDPMFTFLHTSRNHRSIHIQPEQIGAFRKIYPLQNNTHNEELNKLYELVFKSCKIQKSKRPIKYIPPIQNKNTAQNKAQIQKSLISNLNVQQQQKFFAFYNVINSFKVNRLKPSKIQKSESSVSQNQSLKPQKLNIFESDLDSESIRKQELLSYQRKIRKDKQKQKRKFILPMPLNSVSIKLDQKYILPKREVKSNSSHYHSPEQTFFKVNPLLSSKIPQWTQIQRSFPKEKGNHTADHQSRLPNFQAFKKTHLAGFNNTTQLTGFSHITDDKAYSVQLKQKLQRMHFVRLKLQKNKKLDNGNIIFIKKSVQKKASQFLVHHHDQKI